MKWTKEKPKEPGWYRVVSRRLPKRFQTIHVTWAGVIGYQEKGFCDPFGPEVRYAKIPEPKEPKP